MVNRGNIRTKRRRRTQNGGRNKYKTRRDFCPYCGKSRTFTIANF